MHKHQLTAVFHFKSKIFLFPVEPQPVQASYSMLRVDLELIVQLCNASDDDVCVQIPQVCTAGLQGASYDVV